MIYLRLYWRTHKNIHLEYQQIATKINEKSKICTSTLQWEYHDGTSSVDNYLKMIIDSNILASDSVIDIRTKWFRMGLSSWWFSATNRDVPEDQRLTKYNFTLFCISYLNQTWSQFKKVGRCENERTGLQREAPTLIATIRQPPRRSLQPTMQLLYPFVWTVRYLHMKWIADVNATARPAMGNLRFKQLLASEYLEVLTASHCVPTGAHPGDIPMLCGLLGCAASPLPGSASSSERPRRKFSKPMSVWWTIPSTF
jgi:hypothetical protein